jgi:hypothetical protein
VPLTQEKRQCDADSDELRQREINEYDAALQDVNPEIGVDHYQEQTCQKRVNEKIKSIHDYSSSARDN